MFDSIWKFFVFFSITVVMQGCVSDSKKTLTEKEMENICKNKKLEASKPMTNVSLATGSEGPKYQIGITLSSDYLAGREPEEVYKDCMLSLR